MVKPEDVFGENKERDAEILNLHLEALSPEEIIEAYNKNHPDSILNIGIDRINAIVYINNSIVKIDRNKVSTQQTLRIMRQIKKLEKTGTKKDVHDWETLLHDKVDSIKLEHSGEVKGNDTIINIIRTEKKDDNRLPVDVTTGRSVRIADES